MNSEKEISDDNKQEIARDYSLNHSLARPTTNATTMLTWVLLLEVLTVAITLISDFLLGQLGISFSFYTLHSTTSIIVFCMYLKKICILFIELYQHYAPEQVRRRCTLMPSCSEYALLALRKYNVVKGLYKTYVRLTRRCKGDSLIDYP